MISSGSIVSGYQSTKPILLSPDGFLPFPLAHIYRLWDPSVIGGLNNGLLVVTEAELVE